MKGVSDGAVTKNLCNYLVGKENPHVKQDGKRDFITALEAVSADGFVFPPYLIGKGSVHVFS